jgi:hypothetical protein
MESNVAKRKNRKQLRMTAQNEINGETLHREYMEHDAKTLTWMQFGNFVFAKGLAQLKREIYYGEKK